MSHPTPPRDTTRVALILGIALSALLLAGVGVTALVLALGGDDSEPGDGGGPAPASAQTPEDAMREFVDATNGADCEVLVDHPITDVESVQDCEDEIEKARETAEAQGYDFDSFALEIDDLEVVSESDTDAVVTIDVTQKFDLDGESDEYSATYVYDLEKDGDRWIVTDVDIEDGQAPPTGDDD